MGVTHAEKYKIVPHASERIVERFNVLQMDQTNWMRRLFDKAKFLKKDEKDRRREIWKRGNIVFVIDPHQYKLISIWSEDSGIRLSTSKKDINPKVVVEVKTTIERIKHGALRERATQTYSKYKEIAELNLSISHTKSFELIDQKEHRIQQLLSEISDINSKCEDIYKSAEQVL